MAAMSSEVPERSWSQSGASVLGVRQRQSWRPSAVNAAQSLVSRVVHRAGRLMHNSERLSARYEQFTRRLEPWPEWFPWSLESLPAARPQEGRPAQPPVATWTTDQRQLASTGETESPVPQAAALTLPHPALRLAILRSAGPTAPATMVKTQVLHHAPDLPARVRDWSSFSSAEPRASASGSSFQSNGPSAASSGHDWERPLLPTQSMAFQPRLTLNISLAPRQEVYGGFPVSPSSVAGLMETGWIGLDHTPPLSRRTVANEAPSPVPPPGPIPSLLPQSQGVIEQLLDRTLLPGQLPGLELRLLSLEGPASMAPGTPSTIDSGPPTADGATPPVSMPAALPEPSLDINAITDKVYQTLQRHQQLERERRGLY
jgi:hypothetical protein